MVSEIWNNSRTWDGVSLQRSLCVGLALKTFDSLYRGLLIGIKDGFSCVQSTVGAISLINSSRNIDFSDLGYMDSVCNNISDIAFVRLALVNKTCC